MPTRRRIQNDPTIKLLRRDGKVRMPSTRNQYRLLVVVLMVGKHDVDVDADADAESLLMGAVTLVTKLQPLTEHGTSECQSGAEAAKGFPPKKWSEVDGRLNS
jgi:hypothetical protein